MEAQESDQAKRMELEDKIMRRDTVEKIQEVRHDTARLVSPRGKQQNK